jgi:hypothetical protein
MRQLEVGMIMICLILREYKLWRWKHYEKWNIRYILLVKRFVIDFIFMAEFALFLRRWSSQYIYSGTSVYVRFGISPTWYTSCLDAKHFAWYTTFVWNRTRVLELVWVKMSHDTVRYSWFSLSRQNHDCPRASVRQLLPSFSLYFLWEKFVWYTSCLV